LPDRELLTLLYWVVAKEARRSGGGCTIADVRRQIWKATPWGDKRRAMRLLDAHVRKVRSAAHG